MISIFLKRNVLSFGLLLIATSFIYLIAEIIRGLLVQYELTAMFISFCAGFILFIPLVSLVLHPMVLLSAKYLRYNTTNPQAVNVKSSLLANIGIVFVVQILFFLIWMTDAIAMYSIYVDQSSFLAKTFNIQNENGVDLSQEFYWFNVCLAWFFTLLSLVIGLLPCLIARMKKQSVVDNFIDSFRFAKKHKLLFFIYALFMSFAVILPLLYAKFLFFITFPLVLTTLTMHLSSKFLIQQKW